MAGEIHLDFLDGLPRRSILPLVQGCFVVSLATFVLPVFLLAGDSLVNQRFGRREQDRGGVIDAPGENEL